MFCPIQSAIFREFVGYDPEVVKIARDNDWWDLLNDDGNPLRLPDEIPPNTACAGLVATPAKLGDCSPCLLSAKLGVAHPPPTTNASRINGVR